MNLRIVLLLTIICLLCSSEALFAQVDYTPQVNALKQSFDEKKIDAIEKHIGQALKFGPYPASATLQILGQVFNNLPKLNKLEVLSQQKGEVLLRYDFTALGKRESKMVFDESGKIIKLELVDNLLQEQAEAQKALAAQKQAPTPGELAKEYTFETVSFPAEDGLQVSGNLYEIGKDKPVILLCHQAGYNKYEYADIAPKLNQMGFNALAIDQRSGGSFAENDNETFKLAKESGLGTEFLDAEQDIEAAIAYLHQRFDKKVILWGSSYSSSLALFIGQRNDKVSAVISFSPGDYFGDAKMSLSEVFPKLDKPFWLTSSKQEAQVLSQLLSGTELKSGQSQFIPENSGYHGSRALWEGQKAGQEYWDALTRFLQTQR